MDKIDREEKKSGRAQGSWALEASDVRRGCPIFFLPIGRPSQRIFACPSMLY